MSGAVNLIMTSTELLPLRPNRLIEKATLMLPHQTKYLFYLLFAHHCSFPRVSKSKVAEGEVPFNETGSQLGRYDQIIIAFNCVLFLFPPIFGGQMLPTLSTN